ncbi:GPO family capsid scaffolding protein [Stutzerimonas kunmingensis]|uniref:GPO family capsid scaffolding protein n=1 Tax=Stutzerimonas kunmingensis TaxID=1211807 RepID=UPI000CE477A4|nr:GPO family capsid scaffolding protein [Stutzerimonas kunmingensis]
MKRKFKSRWFRVAVEGATTDGRNIERSWIEDMAAQYSTDTYTARINCEHIKWPWPGGDFGAYGSVLAAKAEEVDINGEKKLALFVQIEPNDALLKLNQAGQKLHTSVEVQPKFADTGKAYLIGLAITDSPASLGTEALQFSAQHGTLATRKQHADNLFTAASEASIEFEEVTDQPDDKTTGLFARVAAALGKFKEKEGKDSALFAELGQSVEAIADHVAEQGKAFAAESKARAELQTAHDQLATQFADLLKSLGNTHDHNQHQRPPVAGGNGQQLATF